MSNSFMRQAGLFDPRSYEQTRVVIIGTGGIGSAICVALAKMGIKRFDLYDHDMVEEHNIANQMFRKEDIGTKKVHAIGEIMKSFAPDEIEVVEHASKFTNKKSVGSDDPIVITSVDSLKARKEIFMSAGSRAQLVVDPRMGGNFMSIWCVQEGMPPEILGEYLETMDRPAAPLPCTMQAIAYTMNGCAAFVCSAIRNHLVGNKVPFHTQVNLESFFLNSRFYEDIIPAECKETSTETVTS